MEIDPQTLDACRRGDRRAQEVVFRACLPSLTALLGRLGGPAADVEDLLQSTLLKATQSFPSFRGESSVKTWLCRIAVHVYGDYARSPERRRRLMIVPPEQPDPQAPADSQLETRRRARRLYEHLDTLSPARRVPFVLHVLEGRDIDEVAELVGATRVATRSRIFWARRQLLKLLRRDPYFVEKGKVTP